MSDEQPPQDRRIGAAKVGRPSKLSATVTDTICAALSKGHSDEKAARRAGISPATYYNWINLGSLEDADPEYVEFLERINDAKFNRVDTLLDTAEDMAKKDSRMLSILLAAYEPQLFGKRETLTIEHGQPQQVNQQITINNLFTAETAQMLYQLLPKSEPAQLPPADQAATPGADEAIPGDFREVS